MGKGQQVNNPKPETNRLVAAADYFLRLRNFADTRKYALRARDSDPTHPDPPRLLAIASVLSAPTISPSRQDYYTVLNLSRFESDATRMLSSFKTLTSILNPNSNTFSLSSEAFDIVVKAWSVLSNPIEKTRFDEELGTVFGGGGTFANAGCTFWTMCPYCYYVYEYDKVFEECCLRCSNGRCRRAFHAAAVVASPPPPEVVEKGHYLCPGFVPCGFGEKNGGNLWVPFASANPTVVESKDGDDCSGDGFIIDISDEEVEVQDHGNGQRTKTEGEHSDNGGLIGNVVKEGVKFNGCVESEMEFLEGEDDVLVGFHCDFDYAD